MCEIGLSLTEITYMIRHVRRFARAKTVATPLAQFHSHSFVQPMPYGNVLIMSPWNYPFLLTIDALTDALAAGNTVLIKPSAYAPATAEIIKTIVSECFPPEYVAVVTGGRAENAALLDQKFDMIFFTGGQTVGKEVLRKAAEHLTPAVLELGGKSPCIVDETADIKLAAKRIVFGKFLNCGQTCVAPDHILCHAAVKDELAAEIVKQITLQFGSAPLSNPDYGKIINRRHFDRLCGLIDSSKLLCGGEANASTLRIAPTVLHNVTRRDAVMQEEIFGPVLPVITYDSIDEAIDFINAREHPLALYLFSEDKAVQQRFLRAVPFGGGCINDTIIHLATSRMGFGGVGHSGMGSYHGKKSFETFSHEKSIVHKSTWLDLPFRYMPYGRLKDWLIRKVLR